MLHRTAQKDICHLSNKFVDKIINILEYSLYWDAKKRIWKVGVS